MLHLTFLEDDFGKGELSFEPPEPQSARTTVRFR
jgi:hypothetical protein